MAENNPLPPNYKNTNPTMGDLLNLFKKQVMLELNCHAVATVQSFDPENQTANLIMAYKKTITMRGTDGVYQNVLQDYPPLPGVPVVCLGGGPTGLTFPIAPGDEVLVIFNDRSLDNWFNGTVGAGLNSYRLHSFQDAIAIVGLHSKAKQIADYDTERALLYNGTTKVGVGADKVLVRNALYTLNGLLQELTTELGNLTTALAALTVTGVTTGAGVSGPPSNAAAITTIGTQISTTASKIANLLE